MRRYGWRRDRPDHRDVEFISAGSLPVAADLREWCPRIEDQGPIGSCTAHAATSGLELLLRKAKRPQPELSRLGVYWETRVRYERVPPGEDSGAEIRNVVRTLVHWGACEERLWPYDPALYAWPPPSAAVAGMAAHRLTGYRRCRSLGAVKAAIAGGFPVIGGFSCPASIDSEETARTGRVALPGPTEAIVGGHAVLFIGYDDGTQALEFVNSWGVGWGAAGHGYLPYGYVERGLASDLWALSAET